MIYISNALYLAAITTLGKRPILGWQSIVTLANLNATSEDAERPIENAWNPDTSQYWQASTDGTIHITIDNPNQDPVDYLGIARHNFGGAAVGFTLEESDNGIDWTDVFTEQFVDDNRAIVHYFDEISALHFRLKMVSDGTNPRIAHIKLGQALILPRPIYVGHSPSTLSPRARRIVNGSETGQYLGQIVTRRWHESSCKQENLDPAWVRNNLFDFIQHTQNSLPDDGSAQGTFFWAWRPADYPREIIYAWTEDTIEPSNQRPNGFMEFSFKMQGVL